VLIWIIFTCELNTKFWWLTLEVTIHTGIQTALRILQNVCGKSICFKHCFNYANLLLYWQRFTHHNKGKSRSQWLRSLRRRYAAARLLGLGVRIPPGAWMSCLVIVEFLPGKAPCTGLITHPEESYRVWCVWVCSYKLKNKESLVH